MRAPRVRSVRAVSASATAQAVGTRVPPVVARGVPATAQWSSGACSRASRHGSTLGGLGPLEHVAADRGERQHAARRRERGATASGLEAVGDRVRVLVVGAGEARDQRQHRDREQARGARDRVVDARGHAGLRGSAAARTVAVTGATTSDNPSPKTITAGRTARRSRRRCRSGSSAACRPRSAAGRPSAGSAARSAARARPARADSSSISAVTGSDAAPAAIGL